MSPTMFSSRQRSTITRIVQSVQAVPWRDPACSWVRIIVVVNLLTLSLFSQQKMTGSLDALSLVELLDMDVSVASRLPSTQRDAPGSVTVLTRDEIKRLPVRGLLDLLRFVPGYATITDVQQVTSFGMRGVASDGRVLVMIDGQPMNELLFGTFQQNARISIHQIERVELIRGPSSVQYGGLASFGAINIVTRRATGANLVSVQGEAAAFRSGLSRSGLSALGGLRDSSFTATVGLTVHDVLQHDANRTSTGGDQYNGREYSGIRLRQINSGLTYGRTSLNIFAERYEVESFAMPGLGPLVNLFSTFNATLQHTQPISDHVQGYAKVLYLHQDPWRTADSVAIKSDLFFDRHFSRLNAEIGLTASLTQTLQVSGFVTAFRDLAEIHKDSRGMDVFGDSVSGFFDSKTLTTVASGGQIRYSHQLADVWASVRAEYNDFFGEAIVPALGLVRRWDEWNVKSMVSRAFRAPLLSQIAHNSVLKPEIVTTIEAELGYAPLRQVYLRLNAFSTVIDRPILYELQADNRDFYYNGIEKLTRGIEFEGQYRGERVRAAFVYSAFVSPDTINRPDSRLYGTTSTKYGFPQQTMSVRLSYDLIDQIALSGAVNGFSPIYGFDVNNSGEGSATRSVNRALLHLSTQWRPEFSPGLTIAVEVFNLLDAQNRIFQPFLNANTFEALPETPREFRLRVEWEK